MINIDLKQLNWDKVSGLMPAIIQDNHTFQVLMLGFMNQEALQKTYENGKVTFYSRTKKRLWEKGETSGNSLVVVNIMCDCDNDTLLILVNPMGATCHLNVASCFGDNTIQTPILNQLENIIQQRYKDRPENSYLTNLFNAGTPRIAQKVGEEGVEVAIASLTSATDNLIQESADLLFHLLVLLKQCQINLWQVLNELQNRMK